MIKKYIMMLAVLIVILMFTSTSSASFLLFREKMYERLSENSPLKNMLDRFFQFTSDREDSMSIDTNDVDDGEYDDDSETGPEEDVLLPKIWNVVGEITPDDGNETVDDLEETPVVDVNGEGGTTVNDDPTVEENGEVGINNESTVEENGENGSTVDGLIEIVTKRNVVLGEILQRVVERTFAPGTTESDEIAENIVDTVVVAGGSVGTAENIIVDNVVATYGDQ